MRSKALKLIISILLIISVLCFSFSVFAIDDVEVTPLPPNQDPITEMDVKLMSYYVYACLRAWGINISYEEMVEYNDQIAVQIIDWVLEYLADSPSNYSISQWIAPWQAGYDYWGNLKFNSSLLEDVQDFADWLIDKFNLVDNSTVIIDPTYTMSGVSVYNPGQYYPLYWVLYEEDVFPQGTDLIALELTDVNYWDNIRYFIWKNTESSNWTNDYNFIFFTDTQYGSRLGSRAVVVDINGTESSCNSFTTNIFSQANTDPLGLDWDHKYGNWYAGDLIAPNWGSTGSHNRCLAIPANAVVFEGTISELKTFLMGASLDSDSGYLIAGDIVLPDDSPDYMSGDGMLVVDNTPTYEQITFSGEITNLPAVVSTKEVQNPRIDTVFQPVKAFITMTKDSMELFIQLIYRLPVEANVCIYALMGSMILLGIIKIMREH